MRTITHVARVALRLAPLLALGALGCDSSTQPATTGQLALTSTLDRGSYSARQPGFPRRPRLLEPSTAGVDSVVITRARFALRDIRFKTQSDSANFRATTLILEPDLRGTMQYLSVADVPFGTYRRVEFNVHRVKADDVAVLPFAQRAAFSDFLLEGGRSVIVSGRVYRTDGGHDFNYTSALNVNQKIELALPLEVSEDAPLAYVTMKVYAGDWFVDARGGLLDPTSAADANDIAHNIARSIHMFKDTNRDGDAD